MSEKSAAQKREFSIKIPANTGSKKFSILKFNGTLNVDPLNWTAEQVSLEREDNRAQVFATESKQEFGEGSEYGKAAREEARRKRYGRRTRNYDHDNQPWQMSIKSVEGKERKFRSMREDSQYTDYWVFLKVGDDFHAYKIKDRYQFLPCVTHRTLDSEQAEEKFQLRNKVMNQFALKAQIQKTFKDQDEDAAMSSRTSNLKIKDEGSSDDDDEDGRDIEKDDVDGDSGQKKRLKKPGKKTTASETNKREKKQRVENADDVAAYESDDGDDEGREYDYMSDSGSDTDREEKTVDQKVEEALVAVGDESGMKDNLNWDLDDSEPEEDEEEEEEKEKAVEKPSARREPKKDGVKAGNGTTGDEPMDEGDSSGTDSDDPDSSKVKSVLFMQRKENRKRPYDELQASVVVPSSASVTSPPVAKHSKVNEEQPCEMPDVPLAAHAAADSLDTEYVRRLLQRKPHTTKELLGKVKPRCGQMNKESIIKKIAEILKNIQPYQFKQKVGDKEVTYFSMNRTAL